MERRPWDSVPAVLRGRAARNADSRRSTRSICPSAHKPATSPFAKVAEMKDGSTHMAHKRWRRCCRRRRGYGGGCGQGLPQQRDGGGSGVAERVNADRFEPGTDPTCTGTSELPRSSVLGWNSSASRRRTLTKGRTRKRWCRTSRATPARRSMCCWMPSGGGWTTASSRWWFCCATCWVRLSARWKTWSGAFRRGPAGSRTALDAAGDRAAGGGRPVGGSRRRHGPPRHGPAVGELGGHVPGQPRIGRQEQEREAAQGQCVPAARPV